MTKRVFVSVDLPPRVKEYLRSIQNPEIYWIKWMPPANFHITLNFLGDLNDVRIREAEAVLEEISAQSKPFAIRLSRLAASRDMLWLLPDEEPNLVNLQGELKNQLRGARIGKRERRSFQPHVLMARSKTGRNMRQVIDNFAPQEFAVDRINLYESRLTPGAATHILIKSLNLTS